jgi:hypothetical protein
MELYLERSAYSLEPRSTLNDCRCRCTKHERRQRESDRCNTDRVGETCQPTPWSHADSSKRRNNCNGTVDHERSKSRTSICTHTRVLLLQSALHAAPSSNESREQEMPRPLISNRSALLILNAAISARTARIVSTRYHVKYAGSPRGRVRAPQQGRTA